MVGYVVGLGDRHAQNILIDKATAEVVHIDLGVAFEQGKTLRTPEVVPFRLTRDIVDGMGITGCEGVFRRCCEETMQVLRASHEFLLTIMEVFIHDPLFKWALSPVKALQLQREDNEQNEGIQEVGMSLIFIETIIYYLYYFILFIIMISFDLSFPAQAMPSRAVRRGRAATRTRNGRCFD
jgi:phosphatidylinositol kinase/protein kinase (PI-3  family)